MAKHQDLRPRLLDRVALRLSANKRVDGLWLGVFLADKRDEIFRRVEEALHLIKEYDRLRYGRLLRDIERVWVLTIPEASANYNRSLRACQLSTRFILAEESVPEVIAATIVHEATHARLTKRGIEYREADRPRVEKVCVRRELAFAEKLPNGQAIREQAERALAWITDPAYPEYWTDQAFEKRYVDRNVEALSELGAPGLLVKMVLVLRRLRRRFGRSAAD
jgi:hypothetical protein